MSHLVLHILPSHSLNLELLLFSVFIFIGDDSSDRTASKSLVFLSFFFLSSTWHPSAQCHQKQSNELDPEIRVIATINDFINDMQTVRL